MRKSELPTAITDLLGIPSIDGIAGPWFSNEGTVIKEWFQAVAELLGLPYSGKVTTMTAVLAHYGIAWDAVRHSSTETLRGGGGNLRREAFEDLFSAIHQDPRTAAVAEVASGTPFNGEPDNPWREDQLVLRAIRTRRGQPRFRQLLLEAYEGRCAATDCDAPAALEAAHIVRHSESGTYETRNGILLRADLHTLFDLGLIGFEPTTGRVLLHSELTGTGYEVELATTVLRRPKDPAARPDPEALQDHNLRFALG